MYIVYIHSILYHTIFLAKILQEISKICYHTVMKTLKTPILSDTTKELASFFEAPQDILFFDIETTGFSARSACVYLIGCAYLTTNGWETRQFFAETPDDEADVLQQFFSFSASFPVMVHFNGTTFDVPFLQTRAKKFGLSFVPASVQHDIYKKISPYKNLLHLPGCRQKQLEEFIGIHREDHFNGGELIELYHSYARQPTKELLDILLLHNREDLEGMTTLYRVMAIPLFFEEQGFSPVTLSLEHTEDAFGKARTNAVFTLQTDIPLPVSLSLHGSGTVLKNCFLAGRERTVLLRLPVYDGVLKHFYPDYKNYSYLPAEDTAIHKSVAVYVDKSQRMPATAATCYTKKEGQFLPCFSAPDELPLFRENHKDRQCFLLADDLLNSDASVQKEYLSGLLRALVKTKK